MGKLPFRYNGSNANMLNEINKLVPLCCDAWIDTSTESFCGSGCWTLNRPRFRLEAINDIDGEIVNFFKQLRDNRQNLIEAVKFTPYARQELTLCYAPNEGWNYATMPLEQARKFYVRQMQSRNGADFNPNWKRQFKATGDDGKRMKTTAASFADVDDLEKFANRLAGVFIENLTAVEFLNDYDHDKALHYIDPPFLPETRENKAGLYSHEMTVDEHLELLTAVSKLSGYVILRHYACEMYDNMLHGFERIDFSKRTDGKGSKVESLYVSPNLIELLQRLQPLHSVQQRGIF